ncbi:hypothetical protein [Lacrimispora amygdalina]|uniref:hypothetical protein n=1 Tax=Lacrimispora amygdalina TaxID=253257 RepID=UPI00140952C8|nr:hypothetical protein [Lacrimispora amygdalina]
MNKLPYIQRYGCREPRAGRKTGTGSGQQIRVGSHGAVGKPELVLVSRAEPRARGL